MNKTIVIFCTLLVWASTAQSIVIDINVAPQNALLPNLSSHALSGVAYIGGCTAVPIAERVVVTAAHCIRPEDTRRYVSIPYDDQADVFIYGNVFTYPGYDRNKNPWEQLHVPDLAVIHLDRALPNYVIRYRVATFAGANPAGAVIELAGYGRTGTGSGGDSLAHSSKIKRYARNEIDRIDGNYLVYDFDGGLNLPPCDKTCLLNGGYGPGSTLGENKLGTPGLGTIEGMSGRGDSGGPAFYNPTRDLEMAEYLGKTVFVKLVPDEPFLIGITSYNTRYRANQPHSSYGTTSHYALVAPFMDWLKGFGSDVQLFSQNQVFAARTPATETLTPFAQLAAPIEEDPELVIPPDPMAVDKTFNKAPRVNAPIQDTVLASNVPFNLPLDSNTFEDTDLGDSLIWSATLENGDPLPDWLVFDPAAKTFSGTPTDDDTGDWFVRVAAKDLRGAEAATGFTVTVTGTQSDRADTEGTGSVGVFMIMMLGLLGRIRRGGQ